VPNQGQVCERAAPDDGRGPPGSVPVVEIGYIAQLACAAAGAKGCLLAFHNPLGDACVWAAGAATVRPLGHGAGDQMGSGWGCDSNHTSRRSLRCCGFAVTDDGHAVEGGNRATASGLRGLRERVALLGGRCKLDSKPGGARLSARMPGADL